MYHYMSVDGILPSVISERCGGVESPEPRRPRYLSNLTARLYFELLFRFENGCAS